MSLVGSCTVYQDAHRRTHIAGRTSPDANRRSDTSVCDVASANPFTVSNVINAPSFVTRFARRRYATFCNIAGISSFDKKGNLTGQPPIDSLDLWPYISGEVPKSPREEVYLSGAKNSYPGVTAGDPYVQAFIDKEGYKLVTGQIYDGVRTGPIYPNATSNWKEFGPAYIYDCGGDTSVLPSNPNYGNPIFVEGEGYEGACLFNVFDDPYELNRLDTSTPEYATIALRLSERMEAITMTATPLEPVAELTNFACDYVTDYWGGWLGPWIAIVVPGEGEEEDNGATDNGATAAARLSIGLTLVAILVGWLIV